MKITIGLPCGDMVYTDFAMSLNAACIYTLQQGVEIRAIITKKGSLVHQARCSLVEEARNTGADHLLMVDSDHIFPKDMITRLVGHDKDIVAVHSVTKRPPVRSNCEDLKGQRLTKPGAGLEEVSRIGTGIMLVSMKVFDKLRQPYFEYKFEKGLFKTPRWTGEDYNFCEAARHKGFKIYCDHDLSKECYHIGPANYGVQELERKDGN
jgi:hypothetical protein